MPEKTDSIETAVQTEIDQRQRSIDSSQQWTESDEDYQKAKKIMAHLTSLRESISDDQKKVLTSTQEFAKNYEGSVRAIRKAIAEKGADAE